MTDPINPHVNHGMFALDMAHRNRAELDMLWESVTETLELLAREGMADAGAALSRVQERRLQVAELRKKR